MKYEDPDPSSNDGLRAALEQDDAGATVRHMLALVLHDPETVGLEQLYLDLLSHSSVEVRCVAATCLGHLARLQGLDDRSRAEEALKRAAVSDPDLEGPVEDALDDFEVFLD